VERVLLRALAILDPENEQSRRLASQAITEQPTWFQHLGAFAAMQALSTREAKDPMEAVEDPAQRALMAEALLSETKPPEEEEVLSAIQQIQERAIEQRLRALIREIGDAERRRDDDALLTATQQKMELDRALQQLHKHKPGER